MAVLEKHKAVAGVVKPWLERAQLKTASGIPKPITLQEAEDQLQQAQLFQKECRQYHTQFQGTVYLKCLICFRNKVKINIISLLFYCRYDSLDG